jgi:hypothetical protein
VDEFNLWQLSSSFVVAFWCCGQSFLSFGADLLTWKLILPLLGSIFFVVRCHSHSMDCSFAERSIYGPLEGDFF